MELGTIVYSKSGHDAHRFYVVVSQSGGWVYIADGKQRSWKSPSGKTPGTWPKPPSRWRCPRWIPIKN